MALGDETTVPQGSSRYSIINCTAPELLVLTEPAPLHTRESDIWSLGCTGMERTPALSYYSSYSVNAVLSNEVPFKEFRMGGPE
ncbi:uncharacterized protein EI90DRAFT_3125335 [Cantharellus anzutake]|uniref:uncharacterized protein n=1 Tax=Cantharellus anzutake TaxID=1750568 RepID=UPI001906F79F|nr:uncharacterized protein EI90DRAFT_3125335 [Cantharellus anzutake]KAF8329580.1 hypothetical protein EI90DRAFT_3125335 [Cantharellus anzutake]